MSDSKRVTSFREMRAKLNEPVPEPPPPIDLDGIREKSRLEGHQQAEDQVKAAREAQKFAEDSAQSVLTSLEESKSLWVKEVRDYMGEVLVKTIESLVELPEFQESMIKKSFAEAMEQLADNQPITVYVRPQDIEFTEKLTSDKINFTVKPDPEMDGGVRCSGEQGEWDASINIVMDSIKEIIDHWLKDAEADRL